MDNKNYYKVKLFFMTYPTVIFLLASIAMFFLARYSVLAYTEANERLKYHSSKENYEVIICEIQSIKREHDGSIIIDLLIDNNESYNNDYFIVIGKSAEVMASNGFFEEVEAYDNITVSSASRYFGTDP